MTLITLSRLDLTESVRLAGLLATELPPVLLNRIALRADGVPLFIEELAKDWMERAQDPESALQTLRVPTTLQGSLLARLDRLRDAKHVAQIGSVIGREFSYELISAVADLPESVFETGLMQLVSSGLIHCRGEPPRPFIGLGKRSCREPCTRHCFGITVSRHIAGSQMPSRPDRMANHRFWRII